MYRFKNNLFRSNFRRSAFTLLEVTTALLLLSMILTSVMVLINRGVDSVVDMQLRQHAFELARSNMETLLSETRLSDMSEFGTSEMYPDVDWETIVEPFYEPVTNRMWIRAICSASYLDRTGEYQTVELEHWITNLTSAQIKQILAQQEIEAEYLSLLEGGEDSAIQETTLAYLESLGLDAAAYERFVEKQKRQKLEYITQNGFDGYDEFLEELKEEENIFLEELGMDFDGYNNFAATYVPQSTAEDDMLSEWEDSMDQADIDDPEYDKPRDPQNPETPQDPDKPKPKEQPLSDPGTIPWDKIPRKYWPIYEAVTGEKAPK